MARAPAELRLVADRAAKALAAAGAPSHGDGLALAVSGGADSLALLHGLRTLAGPRGWRLAVITVDHGLRPGSAADAAFVADHAKGLGLAARLVALDAADLADHRAAGGEGAARAARYRALWGAAGELGCDFLATGHTLDDQAETVLLQLLRGAGPDGLAGMAVRSGRLLRPLLEVRRVETRACCQAVGVAWREDPTNADPGPLRNRVRQRLLPLLEELRPGATTALARTARLAADERDWLDPLVVTALAATTAPAQPMPQAGGVDSGGHPIPPWATLPAGAPTSQGRVAARPDPGGFALDAGALAALPVALARRVVRAAARQAGATVPDAGATDRVLALARGRDRFETARPGGARGREGTADWPGGLARRDGPVLRLAPPD
jgi:tRNA(Ile)-lysidine synthetase-like protein